MRLKNKIALVTGAVGQLGRQLCIALAREGATVWVSDLNLDKCKDLVEMLPKNTQHHAVVLDVADSLSVEESFSVIKDVSGSLDLVINNAGIAVFDSF